MKVNLSICSASRSSLLLPALLVVLILASEASALALTQPASRLSQAASKALGGHSRSGRRQRFASQRQQLWATLEHMSMSSFIDEDGNGNVPLDIQNIPFTNAFNSGLNTNNVNNGHYAQIQNGHHHHHHHNNNDNQHHNGNQHHNNDNDNHHHQNDDHHSNNPRPQWNGRKKPRSLNPAMADTAFLRKRTEKLLELSDDQSNAISSKGSMKVDRKTFHFLIDAWAFSGEEDAAEQAIALLHKMEELFEKHQSSSSSSSITVDSNDHHGVRPDVRSYTKVINAISRTASPRAGLMAEDILNKMIYLYESGYNVAAKPNTFTYTAVVEAHANSGVPGSAQNAEEICEVMVRKFLHEQDPDVRPTARSYNAAINAYAKSGDLGAAQRADDLFRRMEDLYLATGLEEVKPNMYNYNSLISAWANCGEEGAARRAEQVLERMEALYKAGETEVKPTTVTYNAVIDAYSKCAGQHGEYENEAGERAESILHHMEELYESGENVDAKPNVRSYNTVINVWAKSRSEQGAKRAEEILDLMERLVEQGDESVRPDVHSFSTVINAWARSQKENKAERALNLLKEMKKLNKEGNKDLRPNVIVANAVMNACAYTTGGVPERNRAMEIAHKVLKDLEAGEYGSPDQVTYGTFLQVCANQMPECSTRDQIVQMIFNKCVKAGQVGNLVLQQLRATTSPEKYFELVGKDMESVHGMEDLPKDWWCNVVEGKWRRRRNF